MIFNGCEEIIKALAINIVYLFEFKGYEDEKVCCIMSDI